MRRFGDFQRGLLRGGSVAASLAVGSILWSQMITGAVAQDATVADVTVGAETKSEEKAQERPRPVVVVPSRTAETQRLEQLSDFARRVPNYRDNSGGSPNRSPNSAIRGVGRGAGGGDGYESDTGFIVDGVFYKHGSFQGAEYVDVESFELGLGPQGTAFGKNTTVGNVVIRTKLPSFTRSATLDTSYANFNRFIEKLTVTGPIIEDRLAYRVAFYFDKGDGWIRDAFSGASYYDNDRWGVRGQLLFVGDDVTDRLIFNRSSYDEYQFANPNTVSVIGDSVPLFANGTLGRTYVQNLFSRLGRVMLTVDPYTFYQTRQGKTSLRIANVSNELNWQFGENTLTAITAWGENVVHTHNPLGNQLIEIDGNAFDTYVDQYSQEVRFASAKDKPLEWTLGLFGFYEKIWSGPHTEYGSQAAQWFGANINLDPGLIAGSSQQTDGKSITFQAAAFGQATYHVDERLALTFGLRDSYEVKGGSNFAWIAGARGGFSAVQVYNAVRQAGGSGIFDTGGAEKSNNALTGVFNPQYKVNENVLAYGLVGRGEKAGAVNTAARPLLSGSDFKGWQPIVTRNEVSWDYELGVKTNWLDGALFANVNLYWTDIFDFQANFTDTSLRDATGQPIRFTYLGNVPHVRLRGVEFSGRWNALERLWISASGAYTEARYLDYDQAAPPADWTWSTPANAPAGFLAAPLTLSLSNTRWTGLPKWAFNIGADYRHPLGAIFEGLDAEWASRPVSAFGYVNVAWQDKAQLTDPHSVLQYWQPAYSLIDAGIGLRADDESYSVNLWAKNVFDTRYVTAWSPGSSTTPASISLQDRPRTFGATLRVTLY